MRKPLTPIELLNHCCKYIDDAVAIEVIMAHETGLRDQLASVSRERDIARLAYMILTGTYNPVERQEKEPEDAKGQP